MPPRAIKHQLTCPFELVSGSFLIGRGRTLVIPRNHLVGSKLQNPPFYVHFLTDTSSVKFVYRPVFDVVMHNNKITGP